MVTSASSWSSARRPRRSGAAPREQALMAQGRVIGHLLRAVESVGCHRGGEPTKLAGALVVALQSRATAPGCVPGGRWGSGVASGLLVGARGAASAVLPVAPRCARGAATAVLPCAASGLLFGSHFFTSSRGSWRHVDVRGASASGTTGGHRHGTCHPGVGRGINGVVVGHRW
jgi:hypothetical protein